LTIEVQMPLQNLLMQKLKGSEVSLEGFAKSTFSCSDYLIFLDNPPLLHLIRTKSETVINHLQRISSYKRNQVIEITLDIANSMKLIATKVFLKAKQVTDRFHVQKLALEAVQEIRIKLKWEALDRENEAITDQV
jgi:hypothetical protein